MPTGVALRDARQQLFDAAERVLARDGLGALTSRAVTTEAGVAKGVLHRHFADFDTFLTELILDRVAGLKAKAVVLHEAAGTSTVTDNLTRAISSLATPLTANVLALTISRSGLRDRLRNAGTARVPLLGEGTVMIATYLDAEQQLGRIAADADTSTIAAMLIGTAHLSLTEQPAKAPSRTAIHKAIATVIPPGN